MSKMSPMTLENLSRRDISLPRPSRTEALIYMDANGTSTQSQSSWLSISCISSDTNAILALVSILINFWVMRLCMRHKQMRGCPEVLRYK